MTVDQIIKATLDGGITLGMLALFAFMIVKLPAMMREAIELATAPQTEALHALAENLAKTQQELERLSVLVYFDKSGSRDAVTERQMQAVLRATGMELPRDGETETEVS